jgi:hypothetical protein
MNCGFYRVRSNWCSRTVADAHLTSAIIEVEPNGTIFVHVGGEPLFAFPDSAAFFGAHSVSADDLEELRRARAPRERERHAAAPA